jgi:hypothetical protein
VIDADSVLGNELAGFNAGMRCVLECGLPHRGWPASMNARLFQPFAGSTPFVSQPYQIQYYTHPRIETEASASSARPLRAVSTLQPTALVPEDYPRMVDETRMDWQGVAKRFTSPRPVCAAGAC